MSKREEVPFTNRFEQVINPGDEVVVVTHCTGSTCTAKGKYLGMVGKRVQAEVEVKSNQWFSKATGEKNNSFLAPLHKSGLKWNSPDYVKMRDDLMAQHEMKLVTSYRVTTLNANRIFKLAA